MNEKAKAFLKAARDDPELSGELSKMTAAELIEAARTRGFELAEDDFKPADGQASDEELANVAGGYCCFCIDAGGGGGRDAKDNNVYGCACVHYGQGGDGRPSDANCVCAFIGHGHENGQWLGSH